MARDRAGNGTPMESVISIIGPGMKVVGDCETDGTIRVEGSVKGSLKAGKAVVVGKDGVVEGDILTQDAVISGKVTGTLLAESRLELQATCRVEGDIRARRMQLEEGAVLNGTVTMGATVTAPTPAAPPADASHPNAPAAPMASNEPVEPTEHGEPAASAHVQE